MFRVSNQRLMHRQGIGFSVHGVVVDRKTLSRIFFLVMGTVGKESSCRAGITKRLNEALPHRYDRSHHHRAAAGGTAGPGC